MPWKGRLTEEQKTEMLQMYDDRVKVKDIAKHFDCHHSYPTLLARRRKKATRAGLKNKRYPK